VRPDLDARRSSDGYDVTLHGSTTSCAVGDRLVEHDDDRARRREHGSVSVGIRDLDLNLRLDVEYGDSPTLLAGQTQHYVGAGISAL
jgi:hypothetical protein